MNILTPKDNYNIDTRPDEIKGLNKIADYVRDQESKEKSISNVATQTISLNPYQDNASIFYPFWVGQTDFLAKNHLYGYSSVPVPYTGEVSPYSLGKTLANPSNLKVTNINEITLDANIVTQQIPYTSGSAVPTSPFSLRYYVVVGSLIPNITYLDPITFLPPNGSPYGTIGFFEFTFNVDFYGGVEYWYITNPEQSRSLSKATLPSAIMSDGFQDFDIDPIGVRPECYELFKNNSLGLSLAYGFDYNDVQALSGTASTGNKGYTIQSHIQENPYWRNIIGVNFNYFGLLSPYTPNS
jgi:hypothetical protein